MNAYEIFFTIGLIGMLFTTGYRIFNIFHKAEKYDLAIFWITVISFLVSYMISFISVMFIHDTSFYIVLFMFENGLLFLNIPLIMGELFFYISKNVTSKRYDSKEYWSK
ncbi:MAG: hypothetical protein ACOC80_15970 [Petrotogales bacterium]